MYLRCTEADLFPEGLLLCRGDVSPLIYGGTGSESVRQDMPDFLPDRLEAGTVNVPGIAGLEAGLDYLSRAGVEAIGRREAHQAKFCAEGLKKLGFQVFSGPHQGGTVSFIGAQDCETLAEHLARQGIAVRAGLHCAPLAHESAGTLASGTVRISFGHDANQHQTQALLRALSKEKPGKE